MFNELEQIKQNFRLGSYTFDGLTIQISVQSIAAYKNWDFDFLTRGREILGALPGLPDGAGPVP